MQLLIIGTNCRLFKMGRIVAWDELSPFGIWDELSLGTNRHRRLGRIVAWDELSLYGRERPKSPLYLRLKKRKVFKICPGRIYEKLRKQFRDTQRVPFMLDKTRRLLFSPTGNKKKHFKKTTDFFLSENVA